MTDDRSIVFLTTPTSAQGSMWRLMGALAEDRYRLENVSHRHYVEGRTAELPDWVPEPRGHLYKYNLPDLVNPRFRDPGLRLIVNLRDPRDLSCNQYHWALQHPVPGRSAEELEPDRARVRAQGIDAFVLGQDHNVKLRSFRAVEGRLGADTPDVLRLSYAQYCLDFDGVVARLAAFLGTDPARVDRARVERERVANLPANPDWIGRQWGGSDVAPGRYLAELRPETIAALDARYAAFLAFMAALERPAFRPLLATGRIAAPLPRAPRPGAGAAGAPAGHVFPAWDAGTAARMAGRDPLPRATLFEIAAAHQARHAFGRRVGRFAYEHLVVPDKACVTPERLPPETAFEAAGPRPLRQYLESPAAALWAPWYEPGALRPAEGAEFFPRAEGHWNHAGAIRYLSAFLRARHPPLAEALDTVRLRRVPAARPEDFAEVLKPRRPRAALLFENGVRGAGAVRWYRNPAAVSGQRALVLHDGLAGLLVGVLPELLREVLFFRGIVFDFAFAERFAPDLVLCLQGERSFVRLPVNGGSLPEAAGIEERRQPGARSFAAFWEEISAADG